MSVCGRCWVCRCFLPRRVAGVRERHVANTQHVHDAQRSQAAVDGVAALHANQTGRLLLFEGGLDVCGDMTESDEHQLWKVRPVLSPSPHLRRWWRTWNHSGIFGTSCGQCRSAPAFVWLHLWTGYRKERRPTRTAEEQKTPMKNTTTFK